MEVDTTGVDVVTVSVRVVVAKVVQDMTADSSRMEDARMHNGDKRQFPIQVLIGDAQHAQTMRLCQSAIDLNATASTRYSRAKFLYPGPAFLYLRVKIQRSRSSLPH